MVRYTASATPVPIASVGIPEATLNAPPSSRVAAPAVHRAGQAAFAEDARQLRLHRLTDAIAIAGRKAVEDQFVDLDHDVHVTSS